MRLVRLRRLRGAWIALKIPTKQRSRITSQRKLFNEMEKQKTKKRSPQSPQSNVLQHFRPFPNEFVTELRPLLVGLVSLFHQLIA